MSGSNPEASMEVLSPPGASTEEPVFTEFVHGSVKVAGATVGYTLEQPITGTEADPDHLGLFIPGFGGFKRTSRALRGSVSRSGLATVSFEPVRRNDKGIKERISNAQGVHVETIEAIVDDLPSTVGITIGDDTEAGEKTLVILPHSMAGLSSTFYALEHPESVFSLNYLATVGFGSPSLGELKDISPGDAVGAIRHELLPLARDIGWRSAPRCLWSALKYYGANPPQTAGEAWSCLTTNIGEYIASLTEADVFTSYAALEHDKLVRTRDEIADLVHHYEVLAGMGHMGPQVKADRMAAWIISRHYDFKARQAAARALEADPDKA